MFEIKRGAWCEIPVTIDGEDVSGVEKIAVAFKLSTLSSAEIVLKKELNAAESSLVTVDENYISVTVTLSEEETYSLPVGLIFMDVAPVAYSSSEKRNVRLNSGRVVKGRVIGGFHEGEVSE